LNQRLFALLLHLFRGLNRRTLETFYVDVVVKLRKDELSGVRDARETGFDELYRALRVDPDGSNFRQPAFERYVARQVDNYPHLLWSVLRAVQQTIEDFRDPHYWQFRLLLGESIGRFAEGRFESLVPLLEDLARHPHGGVATVAGHALRQVCRSTPMHDAAVAALLDRWARGRDAELVWSAIVAAGRCLTAAGGRPDLARKLGDVLATAANAAVRWEVREWGEALERTLARTLTDLITEAANVLDLLAGWLPARAETKPARRTKGGDKPANAEAGPPSPGACGRLVFRAIQSAIARARPSEDGADTLTIGVHDRLLALLPKMIRAAEVLFPPADADEELRDVFLALGDWLSVPEWEAPIARAVFDAVNDADADTRSAVRQLLLRTWLDESATAKMTPAARDLAYQIARKALTRGQLLEGAVCDLPGGGRGVVLVDQCPAAGRSAANPASAATARELAFRLAHQFNTQFDLTVGWFGSSRLLDGPPATPSALRRTIRAPRLVGPALDALADRSEATAGPCDPHFVLAPSWGQRVPDAEDFATTYGAGHPWRDRVFVIPVQGELTEMIDVEAVAHLGVAFALEDENQAAQRMETAVALIRAAHAQNRRASAENHHVLQAVNEAFQTVVAEPVARRLAARPPARWWELLAPHIGPLAADPDAVEQRLRDGWRDVAGTGGSALDAVRVGIGLIHWLAATDFDRAVAAVGRLLADDGVAAGVAIAAARNLFRVHVRGAMATEREQADPARFAAFLGLAPAIAEKEARPWPLLLDLFDTALRFADRPEWVRAAWPTGEPTSLAAVVRSASPALRARLTDLMKLVAKANFEAARARNADPAHAAFAAASARMAERFLTTLRAGTDELEAGKSLLLFVIEDDARCDQFVSSVLGRYGVGGTAAEQVAAVRLGETHPLPLFDTNPPEPAGIGPRPRLLGPALDRLELPGGWTVSRLVVVASALPLDVEDVAEECACPAILVVDADAARLPPLPWSVVGRECRDEDRADAVTTFLRQTQ
jgi:hypothetical protein